MSHSGVTIRNFRIVENPVDITDELYEDFVRLYNDRSVSIRKIHSLLDINSKKYARLRKKALDEGRIVSRSKGYNHRSNKRKARNYTYLPVLNRWQVKKVKDYKTISYGSYESEEIAKAVVEKLVEVDWDKSQLKRIQDEVLG